MLLHCLVTNVLLISRNWMDNVLHTNLSTRQNVAGLANCFILSWFCLEWLSLASETFKSLSASLICCDIGSLEQLLDFHAVLIQLIRILFLLLQHMSSNWHCLVLKCILRKSWENITMVIFYSSNIFLKYIYGTAVKCVVLFFLGFSFTSKYGHCSLFSNTILWFRWNFLALWWDYFRWPLLLVFRAI